MFNFFCFPEQVLKCLYKKSIDTVK